MNIAEHSSLLWCSRYKAFVIRTLTRRQRNQCYICGKLMGDPRKLSWRDPRVATIDHYHPLSKGGGDEFENLHMVHRRCNRDKGDLLPGELPGRRLVAGDGLRGGL